MEIVIDRNLINESNERMHRMMEEITRSLERERNHDFRNIFREQVLVRKIREPSFVSRIDGQIQVVHETELHRLASRKPMSDLDITRMKEILSSNMRTDMYKVDHNWKTPLHNAIQSENLPAIKLLLEHGADCLTHKSYTILLKSFILRNSLNKRDQTLYELFYNIGREKSGNKSIAII